MDESESKVGRKLGAGRRVRVALMCGEVGRPQPICKSIEIGYADPLQ